MADRIPERVWQQLCDSLSQFKQLFGLAVTMLGLMLLWYPFVPRGSATYVIVVLNIVAASGFIVITAPFIYLCGKRYDQM